MSYDIVKTIDRSHREPTMQELVRQAISFGVDRVSLVRRKMETCGAAIVVLMLGDGAICAIGPFLREVIADQVQDREKVLVLHANRPLYEGLTWLEENGLTWAFQEFFVCGQKCFAVYLTGALVTDQLAEELTKRRCMTRLT